MHDCVNEMVIGDAIEVMGNKIKSKAKGSMDEHSAPAGDNIYVKVKSIRPKDFLQHLWDLTKA